MSNSYVSNHIHVVFATKNRVPEIDEGLQPKLWAYMAGITENHGIHAVAISGIEDHVHALINLGATLSISKAVQVLKANSSRWLNEHMRRPGLNGKKVISRAVSAAPRCRASAGTSQTRKSTTRRWIRNRSFCCS